MSANSALITRLRVAAGCVRDSVSRPVSDDPSWVPPGPDSVSPRWLHAALACPNDVEISAIRHRHLSSGTSNRGFLDIDYAPGAPEDLPRTLFVKSASSYLTRLQVGVTGGLEGEIRFYRRIQPSLVGVPSPQGYFGVSDRRSGRAIVLMEDVGSTRSATFGDAARLPLTRAEAESMVDTLGALHGSLRNSPRFADGLRWLPSSERVQSRLNAMVDFRARVLVGLRRAENVAPPALLAHRGHLHEALMASLAEDDQHPRTLLHSDVHADNWFRTDDGRLGLFDWSAISQGRGERDLAYAVMSALKVEDRRAWERELVERYADTVGRISGSPVDPAQAWEGYRRQTVHGLCMWLYTLGRGPLQPRMQPPEIIDANVLRMTTAVADLETMSLYT